MTVVYSTSGPYVLELETIDETTSRGPAVRVTVSGVTTTTTFALTRLCEGRTETAPGWRAKQFIDTVVDTDWAAPTNRPITYTLLVNGVVVAAATITLPSAYAWLQDPLQPDKCLKFTLTRDALGTAVLDAKSLKIFDYDKANGALIPILGSSYPVAFGGQRLESSRVTHRLRTFTVADAAAFRDLIRGAPILLVRSLPAMVGLPALAYLNGNVTQEPFTTHLPGGHQQYWTVTGDIVAAVLQAAVTGSVTYDQVQQLLAGYTYDQVQTRAAATTYLDWQKNPLIFSTL
jgi:hypothetical protein